MSRKRPTKQTSKTDQSKRRLATDNPRRCGCVVKSWSKETCTFEKIQQKKKNPQQRSQKTCTSEARPISHTYSHAVSKKHRSKTTCMSEKRPTKQPYHKKTYTSEASPITETYSHTVSKKHGSKKICMSGKRPTKQSYHKTTTKRRIRLKRDQSQRPTPSHLTADATHRFDCVVALAQQEK